MVETLSNGSVITGATWYGPWKNVVACCEDMGTADLARYLSYLGWDVPRASSDLEGNRGAFIHALMYFAAVSGTPNHPYTRKHTQSHNNTNNKECNIC